MRSSFQLLAKQWCVADVPVQFAIQSGAGTRVGSRREQNEDSYCVDAAAQVFIVADGIGGALAGEKASRMAVDLLSHRMSPIASAADADEAEVIETIGAAFNETNCAILRKARQNTKFHRMGTTAVMALVAGRRLYLASIGDSRAHLVRCGRIEQLTTDHTMAQSLVEAGLISPHEAQRHQWNNVLSKYLGCDQADNEPDIRVIDLQGGDQIVLSSDGLTNVVDERTMQHILQENFAAADATSELIEAADQKNARDDATCVVLFISEIEAPELA